MQFVIETITTLLVLVIVVGFKTTEGAPMPNIIDAPRAESNLEVPSAIAGKARPLLDKEGAQTVYDLASMITDEDDLVPDSSNHHWLEHAVSAGHLHKHKHRRHRRHHKKH